MTDYIALRLDCQPCTPDITDLAAAQLCDIGYESFEPDENGLTAYIRQDLYSEEAVAEALTDFPIQTDFSTSASHIAGRNWNQEWEQHYFKPIVVGDMVTVHSSFHTDIPHARYDIVIDPKMAFGTGHHYTTRLMMNRILETDMKGLTITDMGTGTGILAILCAMRGAEKVTGIEIDEGAWENAVENITLNNVGDSARMVCGDARMLAETPRCDIFMANINRNIILADMAAYAANLKSGGLMFLSGFYSEDVPVLTAEGSHHGLVPVSSESDNNWTVLTMRKN